MKQTIVPDIVQSQTIHQLSESNTALEAAKWMSDNDVGAIVVVDSDGRLLGIVSERDVVRRVTVKGLDPNTTTLAEIMSRNPDTVGPNDTALEALDIMRIRKYRHLPVVDGDRVVGMVSVRDLYEVMKKELEANIRETEAFVFGDRYGA